MKQIYSFDKGAPPYIDEDIIKAELEKRQLRIYFSIIAVAVVLMQSAALLLGYMAYPFMPELTLACVLFSVFSLFSAMVVFVLFNKIRGDIKCQL